MVLSCGEEKEEYCFGFHAFSPDLSVREQIETALEKQNRKDKTKKNFILPKKLGKKEIQWKAKSSHTVGILLLLGAVTGILLKFRRRRTKEKEKAGRGTAIILPTIGYHLGFADWSWDAGIQGMGENGKPLQERGYGKECSI